MGRAEDGSSPQGPKHWKPVVDRWAGRIYLLVLCCGVMYVGPLEWTLKALHASDPAKAAQLWRVSALWLMAPLPLLGAYGALWGAGRIASRGWPRQRPEEAPVRSRSFLERWGGWRTVTISALMVLDFVVSPEISSDRGYKRLVLSIADLPWIREGMFPSLVFHVFSLGLGAVFGLIVSWRATLWALGQIVAIAAAIFWGFYRRMAVGGCLNRHEEPCGLVDQVMAIVGLWS